MNWDAIAAVGEILGAIGVIATLFYLAAQIRQNTASVRASTMHQTAALTTQTTLDMGVSPDAAALFFRGHSDPASLTEEERTRLWLLLQSAVRILENAYFQYTSGVMDEDVWHGYRVSLITNLSSPGGRAFWEMRAPIFHRRFREYVEREILTNTQESAPLRFSGEGAA